MLCGQTACIPVFDLSDTWKPSRRTAEVSGFTYVEIEKSKEDPTMERNFNFGGKMYVSRF